MDARNRLSANSSYSIATDAHIRDADVAECRGDAGLEVVQVGNVLAGAVTEIAACAEDDEALVHAGEQLYPVLNTGFDAFAQAIDAIRGTQAQPGRQRVTLTAPMGLAARWLVPRLGEFATQHPEVDLRIHASDTVVDLHGGSADLAVRYGDTPVTGGGLITEHLFGDAYAPVCHPGLNVRSHDDLTRVPLIHSEWQRTLPQAIGWPMWARAAGIEHTLKTDTGIVLSDDGHAMSAAMAGQGVILANLPLVRDALEAGTLVQPFAAPVIQRYAFWAVAPSARLEDAAVRAVWDWLCACRENTARVHRSAQ